MKQFLVVLVTIFCIQQTHSQYVTIFGGVKPLNIKSSSIQLAYLDESPNPDYFYSNTTVNSSLVYNLGASIDGFKHMKNIYYDLGANLFVGDQFFGLEASASIGYPLYLTKKRSMAIIPTFSSGYGSSERKMGTMINHTTYIQVNSTVFQNYTNVDVSLQKAYIPLRPSLNFLFDASKKIQVRISAAYLYCIYTVNQVKFSGTDNSGKAVSDGEDFNAPNITYTVNGQQSKDSPIDIKGFEFRLGVAINLSKEQKASH